MRNKKKIFVTATFMLMATIFAAGFLYADTLTEDLDANGFDITNVGELVAVDLEAKSLVTEDLVAKSYSFPDKIIISTGEVIDPSDYDDIGAAINDGLEKLTSAGYKENWALLLPMGGKYSFSTDITGLTRKQRFFFGSLGWPTLKYEGTGTPLTLGLNTYHFRIGHFTLDGQGNGKSLIRITTNRTSRGTFLPMDLRNAGQHAFHVEKQATLNDVRFINLHLNGGTDNYHQFCAEGPIIRTTFLKPTCWAIPRSAVGFYIEAGHSVQFINPYMEGHDTHAALGGIQLGSVKNWSISNAHGENFTAQNGDPFGSTILLGIEHMNKGTIGSGTILGARGSDVRFSVQFLNKVKNSQMVTIMQRCTQGIDLNTDAWRGQFGRVNLIPFVLDDIYPDTYKKDVVVGTSLNGEPIVISDDEKETFVIKVNKNGEIYTTSDLSQLP